METNLSTITVFYGIAFRWTNVSHLAKQNFYDQDTFTLEIPLTDQARVAVFGDVLPGVSKQIKIVHDDSAMESFYGAESICHLTKVKF